MSLGRWGIYDTVTGKIAYEYSGSYEEAQLQISNTRAIVILKPEEGSSTHFVDTVSCDVHLKKVIAVEVSHDTITADGLMTVILDNIPLDAMVQWPDNEITTVHDGLIAFSVDLAGMYTFTISGVKYITKEITIEAIPAT